MKAISYKKRNEIYASLILKDNNYIKVIPRLRIFNLLVRMRNSFISPENLNPIIFMDSRIFEVLLEIEMSDILKNIKMIESKKWLKIKDFIQETKYFQCNIEITKSGMDTYFRIVQQKIQSKPLEKIKEKTTNYIYSRVDYEIAKIWFRELRKFWFDNPRTIRNLGNWDEVKDFRAHIIHRCRINSKIKGEDLLEAVKYIVKKDDSDFYLKNIIGPKAWKKRWKNGKSAMESLYTTYLGYVIDEKKIRDLAIDPEKDINKYEDEDGNIVEDKNVSEIWKNMFEILGRKLKLQYSSIEEVEKAIDSLQTICEEINNHSHLNPGRLQIRDFMLQSRLNNCKNKNKVVYWFYVLQKYSRWKGFLTTEMLWDCWMEFWKKVWRLDHPNFSEEDMKQFYNEKYLEME